MIIHNPENAREELYQAAMKELCRQGYEISDITRQHDERAKREENREISELDLSFAVTTPESWAPHFEAEIVRVGDVMLNFQGPKTITLSNIRAGGMFKLSPAWRDVLRERYGLTPTEVIIVRELSFFPNSRVVKRLTLESMQHIADQKARKHVLQACCVTNFTEFMQCVKRSEEIRVDVKAVREVKGEKAAKAVKAVKPGIESLISEYL